MTRTIIRDHRGAGLVVLVGALILITGCGPSKKMDVGTEWPAEWKKRNLYHTPNVYIYASSDRVAGDIDRLLLHTKRDFRQRTKADTNKGLIIVTDRTDELFTADMQGYYGLVQAGQGQQLSDQQIRERYEKIANAMTESGVSLETEMMMRTVPVKKELLASKLDLPSSIVQDVDWVIAMPTRIVIEESCRAIMAEKIKHREEGLLLGVVDTFGTIAQSPFLLVEESRMVNRAAVNRDIQLYASWVEAQAEWSAEQKEEEKSKFMEYKVQEAMFPVFSTLRNVLEDVVETVVDPLVPKDDSSHTKPASQDGASGQKVLAQRVHDNGR